MTANNLNALDAVLSEIRRDIHFTQFKADSIIKLIENSKGSNEEKLQAVLKLAREIDQRLLSYD